MIILRLFRFGGPLVGHIELLGLQRPEDIARLAAGNGADHLFPQGGIVRGDILQDIGGFLRIDAIDDDHIEADIVAVDGFEQQIIP